ncbi:MAG: HYR domain-containing protein [Verrucomicrobiota bacterium]
MSVIMKACGRVKWMALLLMLWCLMGTTRAATYNITNAPGWNLIASQLDGANGNGIRAILPAGPSGSQLIGYSLSRGAFGSVETSQPLLVTAGTTWNPGTNIINPGDGLIYFNSAATNFIMTITGNPHVPVLPINVGSNMVLVARQTNAVASVTNILGFPPNNGTVVYQFIPGNGHSFAYLVSSNYNISFLKGGVWTPSSPTIRVGESVWLLTNALPPTLTRQPTNQTVCPNDQLVLSLGATGTQPLNYQWQRAGTNIIGETNATLTLAPAVSGVYSVLVSNMFGSVTSSNFTINATDTTPPVIFCPGNIVTSCQGTAGVPVNFELGISDNCDPAPVLTAVPPPRSVFGPGTNVVNLTGTDASGNVAHCSFLVVVLDDIPPRLTCPGDRTVIATSDKGTPVYFSANVVDNCDDAPRVKFIPDSGSLFPVGVTPVTCIAFDSSGNRSICVFNVTVVPASCCLEKAWTQLDVLGPSPRIGHSMAYDTLRGRVVLFGGDNNGSLLRDTWEWDGTSWTMVSIEGGPGPRTLTAMAYMPSLGGVVLVGGRDAKGTPYGDTWLWDGVSWTRINADLLPRYAHAMATDLDRDRIVLFGGTSPTLGDLGDTWEFDGTKWIQVGDAAAGPGKRLGPSMAYASALSQMILFGGLKDGTSATLTWNWDGKQWSVVSTKGPSARSFSAMAYNDNCNRIVLFGGSTTGTVNAADTWEWNGIDWIQTAAGSPTSRFSHAMAHDSAAGRTVLFGGSRAAQSWLNDTWVYGASPTTATVSSVDASCGDQVIVITFSEPVLTASAENTNHYGVLCNGLINPVLQAVQSPDPRIVWLYLGQPLANGCSILVNGVQDLCGKPIRNANTGLKCRPDPCDRSSSGVDFWITFPGNYAPDATNPPVPKVYISGNPGTVGAVVVPGLTPPFLMFFVVPPSRVATVVLPKETDLGAATDVIQTNAVRIVASAPVSVCGMNHLPYTSDAYLALPARAIGQTYMVLGYGNEFSNLPEVNGSQFAVAATADNTKLMIVPSATVGSRTAGVPYSITLNRGQTYQLRSTNDAPSDLSGSIIVADQPVSVFGSHQCAAIPNSNVFFCNYIVEQLPPTEMWGTAFLTVPLVSRSNGDTFRVMAINNNTIVKTNGVAIPGSLATGGFFEFQLATPTLVSADKPVLLAQYANSSDWDLVANSDPFMILVQPGSHYGADYTFQIPATDFANNYVNITASTNATSQIELDGVLIPAGSFINIPGTGFAYLRRWVAPGSHRLVSLSGSGIGAIIYGWSLFDAYGYPAGVCATIRNKGNTFTCPPAGYETTTSKGCLAPIPDFTAMVGNGANAFFISQDPPAGTLVGPGTYEVWVTVVDSTGTRTSCKTALFVSYGQNSGLTCPRDISTNCASAKGQFVNYDVGICNTNFNLVCTPPPGTLFPPGTNVVTCKVINSTGSIVDQCQFTINVACIGLATSQTGSTISIQWNGGGQLQKASTLNGPWITITNATTPFKANTSGNSGYFRVVQ